MLTSTIETTTDTATVDQLIERARVHDEEAVIALIERCSTRISAAIQIAGVSRFSAEFDDAQNQALFEIWKQFPSIRKKEVVCFWMHGVARRVTASRIIDPLVRHRNRETRYTQMQPTDSGSQAGPADAVANRDLLDRVMLELSEEHREVLVLRYLEGFSEKETARLLGVAEKTVSSRTTRAKRAAMSIAAFYDENPSER